MSYNYDTVLEASGKQWKANESLPSVNQQC